MEHLKQEIMGQSRHQFIYGFNSEERTKFLKSLEEAYPITINKNSPMAIYLDSFGFPKDFLVSKNLSLTMIDILSKDYLISNIIYNILAKAQKLYSPELLNARFANLIKQINEYIKNPQISNIENYSELLKRLKENKEIYYTSYINYTTKNMQPNLFNNIPFPYLSIEYMIKEIKKALNIDSYFVLLIDQKEDIIKSSTRAINSLINARINDLLSLKVATEPDKWLTYLDQNDNLIQSIHDYGTIEFDDSFSKYIRQLKKKKPL